MKSTTLDEIECMLEEIPGDAALNSDFDNCSDDDEFVPLHNTSSFIDYFDIENMAMLSSIKLV